jgi:ATP-binding cassette subfamily C (CFTR/MRP) protein 1
VDKIRAEEISIVWKSAKLGALFGLLLMSVPTLIGVAAFGTFSLVGNKLSAVRVYTARPRSLLS